MPASPSGPHLPGPASMDLICFPDSRSHRRICASRELEAAMAPLWLMSTDTTPSWWPSRFHCSSSFSSDLQAECGGKNNPWRQVKLNQHSGKKTTAVEYQILLFKKTIKMYFKPFMLNYWWTNCSQVLVVITINKHVLHFETIFNKHCIKWHFHKNKAAHHFQTFTISSNEPVMIVSVPSASLLPHAAVQIASSWAERTHVHCYQQLQPVGCLHT